jgi:hypothetical protein
VVTDLQLDEGPQPDAVAAHRVEQHCLGFELETETDLVVAHRTDRAAIDPSDYELQSRLSYAEAFSLGGTLSLSIHFDATNGVRNDRIEAI